MSNIPKSVLEIQTAATRAANAKTIKLSDGDFLVAFIENDDADPVEDGIDIKAKIYSPDGEQIGALLNLSMLVTVWTSDFDLRALPDNRFAIIVNLSEGDDKDAPNAFAITYHKMPDGKLRAISADTIYDPGSWKPM